MDSATLDFQTDDTGRVPIPPDPLSRTKGGAEDEGGAIVASLGVLGFEDSPQAGAWKTNCALGVRGLTPGAGRGLPMGVAAR